MIIRRSTAVRVPLVLLSSSGTPVTGMTAANINGGVGRVVKANGTVTSLALSGSNFFEIDSVNCAGLYHVLLGTGNTDVLGPLQVIINPNALEFITSRIAVGVEDFGVIYNATVALQKLGLNKLKIATTGPEANRLCIYDDDGVTILYRFDLKDSAGLATTVNPFERDPV